MDRTYSPSVNIIRDRDTQVNYISTPNAQSVFDQIINQSKAGVRSFYITGDYGTGKSSFLWAFEQTLNHKREYFRTDTNVFSDVDSFEFIPIVGSYESLHSSFAEQLEIDFDYSSKDLINAIDALYKRLSSEKKGLILAIDEFGKLLEFASKNDPEFELYFLQLLAEYINDPQKNIILLTTLHQGFSSYAFNLSITQKKEWDKVKGRFKEINFIEPVEQLLFLASERIAQLELPRDTTNFEGLYNLIRSSEAFPLKTSIDVKIAKSLLPFDLLSASVLTKALQVYGQNERSLFSFIDSNDVFGIRDYELQKQGYYNLSLVYDYLVFNFHSLLLDKYNPHFTQWSALKIALEKVDVLKDIETGEASKIIKSIGLLNIFASAGAKLDQEFYSQYSKLSLGVANASEILRYLDKSKIIRFVKHRSQYVLFDGTDLDIELAINQAGNLVERVADITHHLNEFFEFPFLPAKEAYYERGTPRFFEFKISDTPIEDVPKGETDGFINLIFSEKISSKQVRDFSKNCQEAMLFGLYENTNDIRELIYELQKVKKVKENNAYDKVASNELEAIINHQRALLNHYVLGNMYKKGSSVKWFYKGKEIEIDGRKAFNRQLSSICKDVYQFTPEYIYESINKTKPSSQLGTARRNFLSALTENWDKTDLDFSDNHFPPEKTIYLTLLHKTKIHRKNKDGWGLHPPEDKSFQALWDYGVQFLQDSKDGERGLDEFVDGLLEKPFKLKQGFIDVWLPVFLFINRHDFALFSEDRYIPQLSAETLDLIIKKPKGFKIKAFNVSGVRLNIFNRYRELLQQTTTRQLTNESFIETIKPFLIFYKDLPEYAKKTKRLSKEAIGLREAIAKSKDPEKTFFEDFPLALGFTSLELREEEDALKRFTISLESAIRDIRTSYAGLVDRFEAVIQKTLGDIKDFPEYKDELLHRFKSIKKHLLLNKQKVFLQRLESPLDDRVSWLQSIAHACIQKSLDTIDDKDEALLYDRFSDMIHELDNLCEISINDVDESKEEILRLEITSFVEGIQKNFIRLPKSKNAELESTSAKINSILSNNKNLNIAILAKLLREQLKDDK